MGLLIGRTRNRLSVRFSASIWPPDILNSCIHTMTYVIFISAFTIPTYLSALISCPSPHNTILTRTHTYIQQHTYLCRQTEHIINLVIDERLSNSAELLSNTAMTFGENVTLGRKANGPMSHQVRALCSPAEADFYRKQSFLLNDRKARNSKRYQTIDPLLGTFCTDRQGQPKKSVQQMMINNCHTNNNNTNQNNFLTPATTNAAVAPSTILKHKDAITDEPIGRTKIHQSNNPTLTYQVNVSFSFFASADSLIISMVSRFQFDPKRIFCQDAVKRDKLIGPPNSSYWISEESQIKDTEQS